jgi:hypothetical protein
VPVNALLDAGAAAGLSDGQRRTAEPYVQRRIVTRNSRRGRKKKKVLAR